MSSIDQKAHLYACYYYNRGLEKARVHDFSGAIEMLNRSIELNKNNINSRNLLGLCLFEIGEVGDALVQWIISKNIVNHNPLADRFIGYVQNSPTKLMHFSIAIRKYNTALELVKSGADDLALIQLKRALSKNPNYVKAWQLLALIYMRNDDFERAKKALRRSLKTDVANPLSVKYLRDIKRIKYDSKALSLGEAELVKEDMDVKAVLEGNIKQSVKPRFNYQDSHPDYRVFISLVVGMLIGIMTVYALIVPGVKQSMKHESVSIENKYGEEIAEYLTKLDAYEKDNSKLKNRLEVNDMEVDSLQKQLADLKNQKTSSNILSAYQYYLESTKDNTELSGVEQYMLKKKLEAVTKEELNDASAKYIYDSIIEKYPEIDKATLSGTELYDAGLEYYNAEDYETAIVFFTYSYEEAPDNDETLYMLGRSYQLNGDKTQAGTFYKEYQSKFPTGQYYDTVGQWLSNLEV